MSMTGDHITNAASASPPRQHYPDGSPLAPGDSLEDNPQGGSPPDRPVIVVTVDECIYACPRAVWLEAARVWICDEPGHWVVE